MLPMCANMGLGCVPYSPLGKGRLARPWGQHILRATPTKSRKASTSTSTSPSSRPSIRSPEERGLPMAQIAMAWVLSKPVVTAPIVGATKPHRPADAAAAIEIRLTEEKARRIEEPYTTQPACWW